MFAEGRTGRFDGGGDPDGSGEYPSSEMVKNGSSTSRPVTVVAPTSGGDGTESRPMLGSTRSNIGLKGMGDTFAAVIHKHGCLAHGDPYSHFLLGSAYANGRGVRKCSTKAMQCYKFAAKHGIRYFNNPKSMLSILQW